MKHIKLFDDGYDKITRKEFDELTRKYKPVIFTKSEIDKLNTFNKKIISVQVNSKMFGSNSVCRIKSDRDDFYIYKKEDDWFLMMKQSQKVTLDYNKCDQFIGLLNCLSNYLNKRII